MTGFDGFEDLLYDNSCAAPSHPRMQIVTELESRSTKRCSKSVEWSDQIASAASSLSFPSQLENNTTGPTRRACAQPTFALIGHRLHHEGELDTRTCTPTPWQSVSKILWGSSRAATPARVEQGRSFRNGVRFSVQTRSASSVAWRRLCLCGASSREGSPIGGNARVKEVVCRASILLSDAQNRSERTEMRRGLACAPSPIHAPSSTPEPTPGSPGCLHRS